MQSDRPDKKQLTIIFTGLSGVPYLRRACDGRLVAFANALSQMGNKITIFNRTPVVPRATQPDDQQLNPTVEVIESHDADPPVTRLGRLLTIAMDYPREFRNIIKYNQLHNIDCIHVYSGHLLEFVFYRLLAKIINAKTVYQYVEFRSVVKRNGLYHKLNGMLCDKYLFRFFDGIIPISSFLEKHTKRCAPNLPTVKIPPLCDFDFFDYVSQNMSPSYDSQKFVLFCGSAGYSETIRLIIDAYNLSKCDSNNIRLVLVTKGTSAEMNNVSSLSEGNTNIEIKSDLPYTELVELYHRAFVSMIPLRSTVQDTARFPNKIGEYCAAKSVILTTRVGDIPQCFHDKESALIADDCTPDNLAQLIDWAVENPDALITIRNNCYTLGKKMFDIHSYETQMRNFLETL